MVTWASNWASGIAVSVVIASIVELVIPNGKNKKYMKVLVGLFILFSIIGPVIAKFSNASIGKNFDIEKYASTSDNSSSNINNMKLSTNAELEKLYKINLEQDITEKLKKNGYDTYISALSINFVEGENYGKINQISIKVNKVIKKEEVIQENVKETKMVTNNNIEKIDNIEINIGENSGNSVTIYNQTESILNSVKEEIKEYVSNEYDIDKTSINILG